MESIINFIASQEQLLVVAILLIFGVFEILGGLIKDSNRTKDDVLHEISGFLVLSVLTKPAIVLLVGYLGSLVYPNASTFLAVKNFWILLLVYLLVDDFLQYWYHRSAHEYSFLWKLHRPHHAAREMGFLVSYRNAALYYVLMPNIWWIALFTYLGGGVAVSVGLVLKQLVIIGSHSTTRWDRVLYKYKSLSPLAWLVEHVIVTPAFHYAHHGKGKDDEISDPNGNFGNMFSFWDQLFGSAVFTRKYPNSFGLQTETQDSWQSQSFYPIIHAENPNSEIGKGFTKLKTTSNSPERLVLMEGNHLWCSCGFSRTQPFCDGSHHGTKFKPHLIKVEEEKNYSLCNCKKSKLGAICDGSHKEL